MCVCVLVRLQRAMGDSWTNRTSKYQPNMHQTCLLKGSKGLDRSSCYSMLRPLKLQHT